MSRVRALLRRWFGFDEAGTRARVDLVMAEAAADGGHCAPRECADVAEPAAAEVRVTYRHRRCGLTTTMDPISAAQMHDGLLTGALCRHCGLNRPATEFEWLDGTPVAL